MNRVNISDCQEMIGKTGRTFYHENTGILYMNWSCSGVELLFTGTTLLAEVVARAGIEIEGLPWDKNAPTHENHPWLGVLIDDEEEPSRYIEIRGKQDCCLIFQSDEPGTHRIRIVKLTENLKAKLGILGFVMEGELKPLPAAAKMRKRIEFIGDSITCGFGNMTTERDRLFYTSDENGWYSHAAIAARKLNMELSVIGVSGICTGLSESLPNEYGMDMLYSYTDRMIQDMLGEGEELEVWDFATHPSEYVVVNLGTNDATGIALSADPKKQTDMFRQAYRNFLETLRAHNGEDTRIICALGSLDYYLFPDILKVVDEYHQDSGDRRVSVFRYQKVSPVDGWGACGHPSRSTQEKMAAEIAEEILRLESEER